MAVISKNKRTKRGDSDLSKGGVEARGAACKHLTPQKAGPSSVGLVGMVCEPTLGKKRITFGRDRDNDPVEAFLQIGRLRERLPWTPSNLPNTDLGGYRYG